MSSSDNVIIEPLNDLENLIIKFKSLLDNSKYFVKGPNEDEELIFKIKNDMLRIVHTGYTTLPRLYEDAFLTPLMNLIQTQSFAELTAFGKYGTPFYDWLVSIYQRDRKILPEATKAFEEFVADIYDGYLSNVSRKGAKPPEHQTVSPLVKWGIGGAYTWPADVGSQFNMKMSIISLPKLYSENIALWPLAVHECYHDVIHADSGLLNELEDLVEKDILDLLLDGKDRDPDFDDLISWNGAKITNVAGFASRYWRFTMDEAAADVCGILNSGPITAISLALLAITERGGELSSTSYVDDPHPNDALRLVLAREVIRQSVDLDLGVRNSYIDFIDKIIKEYMKPSLDSSNENEDSKQFHFKLYSTMLGGEKKYYDVTIPFDKMAKTAAIVAKVVGFDKLNHLEKHSLSEINSWTNRDQILMQRITRDILSDPNIVPTLTPGPDEQQVYAAHIVSAATHALLIKSTNNTNAEETGTEMIKSITNLALRALNELYESNPVWQGFPILFRSDYEKHSAILSSPYKSKFTPPSNKTD